MTNDQATETGIEWVSASDIKIGDSVVEQDGCLLPVTGVSRERGVLVFSLKSEFSVMRGIVQMRKRPHSSVGIVRGHGTAGAS